VFSGIWNWEGGPMI